MAGPSWAGSGSSGGSSGGVGPSWAGAPQANTTTSPDATQAKLDALLTKQSAKGGGGFFDSLKNIGGDLLGDAAKVISTPASVLVSAGNQLGNIGSAIIGRNQDDPNYRPSIGNFFGDIGKGITAGQVVQQSHPSWSPWVKDVVGGGLGLAADPLNAIAPGTDSIAKEGLVKAGQVVGDDAARAALREGGVDALRKTVEERLAAEPLAHGGASTLEDVLGRGTASAEENLGGKTAEDVVQSRLDALDAARKGAVLKTPGALPDIPLLGSAKVADAAHAIKTSDAGNAVAKVFQNTAGVEADLGKGAADATSNALHTAADAKMMAKAAGEGAGLSPGDFLAHMTDVGHQAVADKLVQDAPEIAQKASSKAEQAAMKDAGFVQLGTTDVFVHPEVDKALKAAIAAPPSDAVRAFDKVMSAIKQATVFNPLNAVQHDVKRITTNELLALQEGGGIATRREAHSAYAAIQGLIKDKVPVTAEALQERGLTDVAANRAHAGFQKLLSENPSFEINHAEGDVGALAEGKKGLLGTRTAANIAEANGSRTRLSAFFANLDKGMDTDAAALNARRGMMDFSNAAMTPFERDKLQRLAMFYKFPRQIIPTGIGFALEHPAQANLMSHIGLGVQQGARNQYGEHIGLAADTPLENAVSGLGSLIQNPEAYALGEANPLITAALDSKKRGVGDILPPVGMAQKHVQNMTDASGFGDRLAALTGAGSSSDIEGLPGPGGIPIPGAITGEDYNLSTAVTKNDTGQANFNSSVAVAAKRGGNLTQKQALSLLADKAGVENPYGMTEGALLQALQDKGLDSKEITTALQKKIPAKSVLGSITTK